MIDLEYQYPFASHLTQFNDEKTFTFATSTEVEDSYPCFFYGNIKNAYIASRCLSVMANTVGAHFALTPGQIAKLKDPIVSIGAEQINFEAFSSCNSVYTRINIIKEGIDGEFMHSGTTNIDFNDDTIRAFNNVLQSEKLLLGIGAKEVHIITNQVKTIEKNVTLPNRWIKGLGNVQVILSEMELTFELSKIESIQLFKSLPKADTKSDYYLCKTGNNYSFSPIQKAGGIKVGGIHRLNLFQKLVNSVDRVLIYKHQVQDSFALILSFGDIQMTFLLSNSIYRGFSGEGKLLVDLSKTISQELVEQVNLLFKTNQIFNPILLSIENDVSLNNIQSVQSQLSSIGLLGFDLLNQNYFYRRLPFKLERLVNFNPRLENAKKIINNSEIEILEIKDHYIKARVKGSGDVYHTVIKNEEEYQCTCNWFTNNKNLRGYCKHILALGMVDEASDSL